MARGLVFLVVVSVAAGCASTAFQETTFRYYTEGPEQALETIDRTDFREADATLAALERSVALLEVGEYAESAALLHRCEDELEAARRDPGNALAGAVVNDEAGAYRAESFERVLVPTFAMADLLALQDLDGAAEEAERALATIDSVDCPACRFELPRYLAAVTYAELGDLERSLTILAEAVAESPGAPFLEQQLDRLAGDEPCAAVDPEDQPGPATSRVLYVILLLGRGPVKVQEAVPFPWSHEVAWPRYLPRLPEGVSGARLEVPDAADVEAVLLTDVNALAQASLRARLAGLVTKEIAKSVGQEVVLTAVGDRHGWEAELFGRVLFALADRADLRHWSTLPASGQVIRAPLADDLERCDLVFLAADGTEVDREILELPPDWTQGALFVTRRMP